MSFNFQDFPPRARTDEHTECMADRHAFEDNRVCDVLLSRAIDAGHTSQILISHSGFLKMHRSQWGGAGYGHLLDRCDLSDIVSPIFIPN